MKFATVAACPVFGGKLAASTTARRRRSRACTRSCASTTRSPSSATTCGRRSRASPRSASSGTTARTPSLAPRTSSGNSRVASQTPGVVARNDGDANGAMASAATKIDAVYELPFLAHATMEPMNCTVHVRTDGCEIWVGTQVAEPCRRRPPRRSPASRSRRCAGPQPSARRRLRPPARGRRHRAGGRDREAGRRAGEGRLDPRGRHPARHLPALLLRPASPRASTRGQAGRLDRTASPAHRSSRAWLPPRSRTASIPTRSTARAGPALRDPRHPGRVRSRRSRRACTHRRSGAASAPTHNIFVVESFIDELAAAAKQDPLDIPPRAARQAAARAGGLELAAEQGRMGHSRCRRGRGRGISRAARLRQLTSRRSPRWRSSKEGEVQVDARGLRRRLRHASSTRTPSGRRWRAASSSASAAALCGEITLKDGRVEQTNFDDYRVLRINETPLIEVHLVKSTKRRAASASRARRPSRRR